MLFIKKQLYLVVVCHSLIFYIFYYFISTYKKLTYCENIVKFAYVNITVSSYKYLKENKGEKKNKMMTNWREKKHCSNCSKLVVKVRKCGKNVDSPRGGRSLGWVLVVVLSLLGCLDKVSRLSMIHKILYILICWIIGGSLFQSLLYMDIVIMLREEKCGNN